MKISCKQLLRYPTAINRHWMSSNKRCGIRTKPDDRLSHFFRLTHSSYRFHAFKPFFYFLIFSGKAINHRGFDYTRANGIDANAGFGVLKRCVFGETKYPVLRGYIRRYICKTHQSRYGCIVYNSAFTLLHHVGNFVFHTKPNSFKVYSNRFIPILIGTFMRGC